MTVSKLIINIIFKMRNLGPVLITSSRAKSLDTSPAEKWICRSFRMVLPFLVVRWCFSSSPAMAAVIKNVTFVGGGLMGSGIAQVAAQTGHNVTLVDVNEAAITKVQSSIKSSLQRVAKKILKEKPAEGEKFVSDVLGRLKTSVDVNDAVKDSDIVVEAIIENMDLKH